MEKKDKILGYTKTGIPYGFQGAVFPHAMFPALERAVRACLFPFTHLLYKKFFKGRFNRFLESQKNYKIQEVTTLKISQPPPAFPPSPDHRAENPSQNTWAENPSQITGWKPRAKIPGRKTRASSSYSHTTDKSDYFVFENM